ncbi:hypothetical protein DAPPUDRAFT_323209 [Daphnia pulex]|uniref:C1q domain-containing protein n=1 Tax=Daphnia pulex TaxID=6669 RepID=E9GY72_DAPPU|nr:hypothetical protein DAPPUDRAFT_323209 [Daphnia pulex]|eukprot:EFX75551.1 hypothetical protein DAPPUDRAFT_323209 [Daphnia pulex]
MKQTIILIFVSLTAYGFTSSAQQATTWTNPYFYYHYNTPLESPGQKISANELVGNQKQLSGYDNDDHSIENTLSSHVVLLTTCLRELITTKSDLFQTRTEVENVRKELNALKENSQLNSTSTQLLANVMATVENLKNEMITKKDLAQTTQHLEETFSSVESVKNELANVMTKVENLNKDTNATKADLVKTHTEVESVKKELNEMKENSQFNSTSAQLFTNVMTTVENMKNEMITKTDLQQTTQRLDETHTLRVESVKNELTDVMTTVKNLKKDTDAAKFPSSIGRMPTSCDDLQQIGHTKSGLFSVMGNQTVDNVYCDFTKPTTEAGFQKRIGYVDVKTSPVYFYAQKTSNSVKINAVIPFDLLRLNVGNALNTSGIFVTPIPGKYFFSYSGISSRSALGRVELQVKTATANWSRIGQAFGSANLQTFSLQANLELAKGDQIRLLLVEGAILDDAKHYTNFVGQLLEEDIIQ